MERYKLEIVNNHGDRYVRCEPAPDGSWVMFKDVKPLQARIAEIAAKDARIAELERALGEIALRTKSAQRGTPEAGYFSIAIDALGGGNE